MKCPKCGYNSFEYLNSCKKCNTSLVSFKETIGLHAGILPAGVVAAIAAVTTAPVAQPAAAENRDADVFTWDLPASDPIDAALPDSGLSNVADEQIAVKDAENDPIFGELPPLQPDESAPRPGQSADGLPGLAQLTEATSTDVFGEFSFDDQPAGSAGSDEPTAPNVENQPTLSEFSFDAFGDLSDPDLQNYPSDSAPGAPAEFDLSSFLATDTQAPAEATAGDKGNELEALFGELTEPEQKN